MNNVKVSRAPASQVILYSSYYYVLTSFIPLLLAGTVVLYSPL